MAHPHDMTHRRTTFGRFIALVLIALFAQVSPLAPTAHAISAEESACGRDVMQHCPGIKRGQGIWKCLKQNESKISMVCKNTMARKKAAKQKRSADCAEDLVAYCSDSPRGKGRLKQCLKRNLASVSPQCKKHLR